MTASRRQVIIGLGGGVAAALLAPVSRLHANGIVEIAMAGRPDGSRVWFDPVGLHVRPGQTVHWINRDAGNAHTATAYDRGVGRPHRIPEAAEPWDSGYLLPGESFSIVLTEPGVYDYYCVPHELAGMVGRIIVGTPPADGWAEPGDSPEELPAAALKSFPSVEDILAEGIVRHRETR